MTTAIFDPRVWVMIMSMFQQTQKAATAVPLYALSAALNGLVSAGVMLFEWELMVRIFTHIAAEDSEYWSPAIMGLTAFILVIAIHTIAEQGKHSGVLHWLDKIAALLVPVYLLGIGMLLSVLLFNDGGIGDMLDNASDEYALDVLLEESTSWLTVIMGEFASPIASVLFCAGIGALAIINVYVAHHAIGKTRHAISEAVLRSAALKTERALIQAYKTAKTRYEDIQATLKKLNAPDDGALRLSIATNALIAIQEANRDNENRIVAAHVTGEIFEPVPALTAPANTKELDKTVKAISAITLDALINEMKPLENDK